MGFFVLLNDFFFLFLMKEQICRVRSEFYGKSAAVELQGIVAASSLTINKGKI